MLEDQLNVIQSMLQDLLERNNESVNKCSLVDKDGIPLCEKMHLTVSEACKYYNIGENKMREMINDKKCNFVLNIGTKKLIKRKKLDEYLDRVTII